MNGSPLPKPPGALLAALIHLRRTVHLHKAGLGLVQQDVQPTFSVLLLTKPISICTILYMVNPCMDVCIPAHFHHFLTQCSGAWFIVMRESNDTLCEHTMNVTLLHMSHMHDLEEHRGRQVQGLAS